MQIALGVGMTSQSRFPKPDLSRALPTHHEPTQTTPGRTAKRLADGVALLERLDEERAQGRLTLFGRLMELRIIWRELVELEFQANARPRTGDNEPLIFN